MESLSHRREVEQQRKADIRRQITLLQAELNDPHETSSPASPKRKEATSGLLAPASPSPKKRKLSHARKGASSASSVSMGDPGRQKKLPNVANKVADTRMNSAHLPKSQPSTVLQKLADAHSRKNNSIMKTPIVRSAAFSDNPAVIAQGDDMEDEGSACTQPLVRDDRLALVEDLPLGPAEHKAPFDDPYFEKLEPNSGIRLMSRSIPYGDFQDYLRGRYYLSPSRLYSVVRPLPNKQGYDVPVSGDWVTIGVVAERGKLKYSQAPVGIGRDDKVQQDEEEDTVDQLPLSLDGAAKIPPPYAFKGKNKRKDELSKPSGKKYVNLKLIDFGCRSRSSSSVGKQATIRGDASLSLLLFESDGFDVVTKENGKKEKIYKGGSRGAFEKMSILREGAVVALLNPRILKPFQRSANVPHPTDNILAITPESVSSLAVIGYSQDLGMCKAIKRDGSMCGSWCDKRVSDVCDWHIQHAVERKRAGRAEFSTGTSGMSSGAKRKNPAYDPARQWGLRPSDHDSGACATYVVSGHIVSGNNDSNSLFVSESMGRDAQAKASRKISTKDADRALQQLLKRDKEGSKALFSARQFSKRIANTADKVNTVDRKNKAMGKSDGDLSDGASDTESSDDDKTKNPRKNAYSAHLIRQLGFDPTAKDGRRPADTTVQSKLDALTALQACRKEIDLGPRPGKLSTCVSRPKTATNRPTSPALVDSVSMPSTCEDRPLQHPHSDDDESKRREATVFSSAIGSSADIKLVDLDSSDVELEADLRS
ncbi:hypothetical protein AcV7_005381 [Taiwanofungus camphoratus]|nr:hypothetical protein AcV7_005381 [Antrodia cinnamomea]